MVLIQSIYRYPIKGLSGQPVSCVDLEAGKPFPFDRIFALARPDVSVDWNEPKWCKKGMFVMLMLDEGLAQVQTHLDVQTLQFNVSNSGNSVLTADLGTAPGRKTVEAFFTDLAPRLPAPPKLVRSKDGHFMDKPENVVSVINLATVRKLSRKWGCLIDPLRFRANFYIDGLEAWEEFGWIGQALRLGDAVCRVDCRNGRCGATNVNPATGKRDMDIPSALRRDFGHKDLGVYLAVTKAGRIAVDDPVTLVTSGMPALELDAKSRTDNKTLEMRRYICRGCYLIYDEAAGLPAASISPGTRFTDIPSDWRCADCGTEKSSFKLYEG